MEPDVVQRARQGNQAAWNTLVQEHQEGVFRLAYLLVGDADQAEDIAQEVFIRAFRMLHRFDPARPLRPWLLRITSNLARNHLRSVGRYLGALRRLSQSDLDQKVASAEQEHWQRWEVQALWRAVRRLNVKDQQVIYLRYFLDLPLADVAETLGVPPGTVKSRLHRALERLRAVIEQEFPMLWEERIP
jgi:RNA polymerase sigma-70 factor (ECF subfamily)